jgi:hypothetical protein
MAGQYVGKATPIKIKFNRGDGFEKVYSEKIFGNFVCTNALPVML